MTRTPSKRVAGGYAPGAAGEAPGAVKREVRGDGAGSVRGLLPVVCGSSLAITWFVTGIWVERHISKARKYCDDLSVLAAQGKEQAQLRLIIGGCLQRCLDSVDELSAPLSRDN